MTAADRLKMWSDACRASSGGDNLIRLGEVLYSFDAHPREQKNGALVGRFQAQRRGDSPKDIGGFKISASGQVLEMPAELAGREPFDPAIHAVAVSAEELAEEVAALTDEERAELDTLPVALGTYENQPEGPR